MQKIVVLVLMNPAGVTAAERDADAFRKAIQNDPELRDRVLLRFAHGETAREAISEAEVVACGSLAPELLEAARRLRWVSFWSAGMDNKVSPALRERSLRLTNASGVHGTNMAEHVMAWMLMFTRRMHLHLRSQMRGQWIRGSGGPPFHPAELADQTLGIVGLGRIGEALAERAKAFAMRVVAVKRSPDRRYSRQIAPDALYGPERLNDLLAESDHVCIALPYTPETHHLLDAQRLARMKRTAFLYNIGRGKVVEESALIGALQNGQLAGAGLDVFEQEPLPEESPLWHMENVLITPHVSGNTPRYFDRAAALFAQNLKRYLHDLPLENLYDPERGY